MALVKTDRLAWYSNSAGSNGATTPSFTASDNSLLIATVYVYEYNQAANPLPSLTLASSIGTPELVLSQLGPSPYQYYGGAAYKIPITTGGSMTLTVDCGALSIWAYVIHVLEFTDYNTSSPIGATGSGTDSDGHGSASITLSANPASTSYVIASASVPTSSTSASPITPGSGWTELYESGPANPDYAILQTQGRTSSTSTDVSWDLGSFAHGEGAALIALEIKVASGAMSASLPIRSRNSSHLLVR